MYSFNKGLIVVVAAAFISTVAFAAQWPLKGIVFWRDNAEDHPEIQESIALEFSYFTPSSLVPGVNEDGTPIFDWAPLDALLKDIASRKHQAILRFRYEYPNEKVAEYPGVRGATGVPKYIKALPDYHETFSQNPGGDGPTYYADWSHPALEEFTIRFHEAFAERYDADPRLAFLEVGFGHWAEYHTHGTEVRPGRNFPSKAFQERLMRLLTEKMRLTPWLISIDAAQSKYSDFAKNKELASELNFGLFDDTFMYKTHDISQGEGWNEKCWLAFGEDRWRRAPCGGEVSYYEKKDQREFLAPKGVHGVTWEQAAAKYHMTFVIGNDSLSGKFATPERLMEAAANCGYRFRLVSVRHDGKTIVAEVANDGVAPLYHEAYLTVDDADEGVVSSESLRLLMPGETRTFHIRFKGKPDLGTLRIVSPKLLPGATLPLQR